MMMAGERIRLFPSIEQESLFYKFCNTARFVYNECLAHRIELYQSKGYLCTVQDLIQHIQSMKYSDEYIWLRDTPEAVTKQAIKDLDMAYRNFFKRGNKGFPKFKRKGRSKLSFYVRSDKFRWVDDTHIKITGIKAPVRIRNRVGISRIYNARISFDGKYWYLSFAYEIPDSDKVEDGRIIGVDLGVKNLAVTSDNKCYANINRSGNIKKLERRKKHLQRKLSNKYRLNKDGNRYVKTSNIMKLEDEIKLIDRRLKNIRDTYIHTVTMDIVRTKPYAVVIEDLNVSGMLKNKHLSKAVQQQEFHKFRRYITYKCEAYGSRLVVANRYYPSSKKCSCCGVVKKFLSLSERIYNCSSCGLVMDRDLNAAINLANYGKEEVNLAS